MGPGAAIDEGRAGFWRMKAALAAVVLASGLAVAPLVAASAAPALRPHDATGSPWAAPVEVVPPANAGAAPQETATAIACASTTSCTAVGDYLDTSGDQQG